MDVPDLITILKFTGSVSGSMGFLGFCFRADQCQIFHQSYLGGSKPFQADSLLVNQARAALYSGSEQAHSGSWGRIIKDLKTGRFRAGFALILLAAGIAMPGRPAAGQPAQLPVGDTGPSVAHRGYEVVAGVTSRAQALIVFDGGSDKKLAVMTGSFVPSPQIFLTTPLHPFGTGEPGEGKMTRSGYYWKYSYNRFSLDRQEDPDTGGIGPASPVYNYGTKVEGDFFAVAPVIATETLKDDGSVKFRLECGLGLGYLSLDGDIVLGDQQGDPLAPTTQIHYSGLSWFLFAMGRHYWGPFMLGYQLGISATGSTRPYSYSQSYLSLDLGYRVMF